MKLIRKIVNINEELCNGCGSCILDCHEAAIHLVNGKAVVIKDSLCDGLGDCLGACPTGAITIEERAAVPYDEAEVKRRISAVSQWPLKIRLVSPDAQVFDKADLVIAADCAAFADPEFHRRYSDGSPVIIGCPKFDDAELYRQRFLEIFMRANLNSVTVVRMSVPCCSGISRAAESAAEEARLSVKVKIMDVLR